MRCGGNHTRPPEQAISDTGLIYGEAEFLLLLVSPWWLHCSVPLILIVLGVTVAFGESEKYCDTALLRKRRAAVPIPWSAEGSRMPVWSSGCEMLFCIRQLTVKGQCSLPAVGGTLFLQPNLSRLQILFPSLGCRDDVIRVKFCAGEKEAGQ